NGIDLDALFQRSRIYLDSERYTEAEADLNMVLRFRANSSEAHYLLSKVRLGAGDLTLQKHELGQALKLDPTLLAARIDMSQTLLDSKAAQSALRLLEEAPKEQRNSTLLVLQRNWALLDLGKKDEARKGIDVVLATGEVPEALLQDARLKMEQGNFAAA